MTEATGEAPPRSVEEIKAMLDSTEKGGVRNSIHNCLTVFQNDPVLSGAIAKNLLTERIDVLKPIGGQKRSGDRAMTDTDMKYIRLYLEDTYGLTSEKKIADAADLAADCNCYHPVRDYLNCLKWDGTERIRFCLHRFLGSDTDDYTYEALKGLMHDARVESVVCATDAGREGELIFRLVYHQAGCDKPMKRLWISSMEESAIREGFENLQPGSDYDNLYYSALCRQRADWLVGLNGTRLFTVLYGGKVLKVGRVQTPTLAMLVEREEKIRNFKKEQYYMAHILMDGIDAATERIDDKAKAEGIAAACESGPATVVSVTKERKTVQPPKLYDLTTLQRDANRLFGFTAKQTLEYTQSLYEKKLVTYPRTDSQYLSDDMEETARSVIQAVYKAILFEEPSGAEPDIERVLDSKKVTDHHAIIPTVEITKADLSTVPQGEMKILSLSANRLLCATGEKHEYETVKAEFSCNEAVFTVSGKAVTRNGWKDFEAVFRRSYKTAEDKEKEDMKLPELSEGMSFEGVQTKVTEHFTQPPKHFSDVIHFESRQWKYSERKGAG